MRTMTPNQARNFSGFDFCQNCYESLNLKTLEMKEVKEPFQSLADENTVHLFEALVTVASKFDKKEAEKLFFKLAQVIIDRPTPPQDILPFLVAIKALQESEGSEILTTVGDLALLNMSRKLASEVVKPYHTAPPDDHSSQEMLDLVCDMERKDCALCMDILDQLEHSEHTELIRQNLTDFENSLSEAAKMREVDFSTVEEGIYLKCTDELVTVISSTLGEEHAFSEWSELKETFRGMEKDFEEDLYRLVIPEEGTVGPVYSLVEGNKLYLTTHFEEMREAIRSGNLDYFLTLKEVPFFVLERAAGGLELLEKFVEKALIEKPEDPYLIMLYSSILEDEEKMEEMLQFLEKKVAELPNESGVLLLLATLLEKTGEGERALSFLEKITEIEPENWRAHLMVGEAYEDVGEFQKAVATYEHALELNPENLYLQGLVNRTKMTALLSDIEKLLKDEKYEEALAIVDEHFDPVEVTVFHYYKGLLFSRTGEPKKALELMTDYLDIFSDDEEGWMEKALIYLSLRQYAAAARCFRRCHTLTPQNVEPLVMEALCHRQIGQSRTYKRCINEARRIDSERTKALLKRFNF